MTSDEDHTMAILDGSDLCPVSTALEMVLTDFQYDPRTSVCDDALGLVDTLIVESHPARDYVDALVAHHVAASTAANAMPWSRRGPHEKGPALPGPMIRKAHRLASRIRKALVAHPMSVRVLSTARDLNEFRASHQEDFAEQAIVTCATRGDFAPEEPGLTYTAQQLIFYDAVRTDPDDPWVLLRPVAAVNMALLYELAACTAMDPAAG